MVIVLRYDYLVPFMDREVELRVLEDEYARDGFSLVMVYGRRRVGKTRLLQEFMRGRRGVYYVAAELEYGQLCREFQRAVSKSLNLVPRSEDVVEVLEELAGSGERLVVVLDEFQYMVEADPTLPSRLQRSIDTVLGRSRLMLVLCGSAASFFERKLLGYNAPLYGRRTANLRLRPLRLLDSKGFLQGLSPADAVRIYSMLGGTPAYLAHAYGKTSVEAVLRGVLRPGSPLLDEAEGLLRQELREPRRYMALLKAVAEGRSNPYEAANAAGVDPRTIHRYLEVLEELDIIQVRRPLGFKRGSRVFFRDHYFRFWFTYILPLRPLVEAGQAGEAVDTVLRGMDRYVSTTFEQVVEESLPELRKAGAVPTKPVQHGPWWHRGEEIDLVVREPGVSTTFVEAKWSDLDTGDAKEILRDLEEKSAKTGLQSPRNYYVLVARSIKGQKSAVEKLDSSRITVDFVKFYTTST